MVQNKALAGKRYEKMYMYHFFKTEQEARAFQKKQGLGALYKNTPKSRTKESYMIEAAMAEKSNEFIAEHPFVVAWNA